VHRKLLRWRRHGQKKDMPIDEGFSNNATQRKTTRHNTTQHNILKRQRGETQEGKINTGIQYYVIQGA
jgi:hypothetical protein